MRWLVTLLRLALIVFSTIPFATLALVSIPFDRKGIIYFWCGTTWSRFILFVCGIRIHIRNVKEINKRGNYIVVSNHASMFDIPAMMSIFPRLRIMFKKELSYIPIWGWAIRWGHHIMVDRKRGTEAIKSLDRAAEAIKEGGQVLLFAEGTRTRDGKLQPFKRGAFSLAAKSGAPIVPLTINGSFKILPKGSFDIRPANIEVIIDKPIDTAWATTRDDEMKLMEQTKEAIQKHYREPA